MLTIYQFKKRNDLKKTTSGILLRFRKNTTISYKNNTTAQRQNHFNPLYFRCLALNIFYHPAALSIFTAIIQIKTHPINSILLKQKS